MCTVSFLKNYSFLKYVYFRSELWSVSVTVYEISVRIFVLLAMLRALGGNLHWFFCIHLFRFYFWRNQQDKIMRFLVRVENSEFSWLKIPLQCTFPLRGKNCNLLSLYLHELCFFLSLFGQVSFVKFDKLQHSTRY